MRRTGAWLLNSDCQRHVWFLGEMSVVIVGGGMGNSLQIFITLSGVKSQSGHGKSGFLEIRKCDNSRLQPGLVPIA